MEKTRQGRNGKQSTEIPEKERETLREGARQLTDRDTSNEAASTPQSRHHSPAQGSERKAYRPDANIDNEKHSSRRSGSDLQPETPLVPGASVSREKRSRKEYIEHKAEEAKSSRRRG